MKEYVFQVTGMMCGHCEARVNAAMKNLGAEKVTSDHAKNQTVVLCEDLNVEQAKQAIRSLGYAVADDVSVKPYEKKGLFGFFKK